MKIYLEDPICGCVDSEISSLEALLDTMLRHDGYLEHRICDREIHSAENPGLYYLTFEVFDEP